MKSLLLAALALVFLLACGSEDPPAAPTAGTPAPSAPAADEPTTPPETAAAPEPAPAPSPAPAAEAPPASAGEAASAGPYACIDGDPAKGREKYALLCASCHGAGGAGDGPASAGLAPKPAAHNDGAYMNALTNAYLEKVIAEGGAAVGKSPMMAPWGATLPGPELGNVVAFVRSLAVPPYACP
jgi:mono/diheme cytochrome c family protein